MEPASLPVALSLESTLMPVRGYLTFSCWGEGLEPSRLLHGALPFFTHISLLLVFKQFPGLCLNHACPLTLRYTRSSRRASFTAWQPSDSSFVTFNWIWQCGINPLYAPSTVAIWHLTLYAEQCLFHRQQAPQSTWLSKRYEAQCSRLQYSHD